MRHANNRTWAAETIAVIPMIETVEAIANIDEILSVPGIDAIYVGPNDLSITLGLDPSTYQGSPIFDDAIATIVDACHRHGVVPGIHATGAVTPIRREQGFRMITVTSDAVAMRAGFASEFAAARQVNAATATSGSLY
jgi:4-hydroxy-2-oxoheptanedioate aldolase